MSSTESDLAIYAGPRAYRHIQSNGLHAKDISTLIGSAGGPKALALTGLDQYLFGDWLNTHDEPLWLFGSSIASWRFACAAQSDPHKAFADFAQLYIHSPFLPKSTVADITRSTQTMLKTLLGDADSQAAILNHPRYRFAITVARSKGWAGSRNPKQLGAALLSCMVGNYVHPAIPHWFFERVIVHDTRSRLPIHGRHQDLARYAALDQHNLFETLAASTAIPLVIDGVNAAHNWPAGLYRDGGLVDYNFCTLDLDSPGLTLFPHFTQKISASWFDKYLPRRQKARRRHSLDNLILLCPTERFYRRLKDRKIPDRSDYKRLPDADRRIAWQNSVEQSQRLGEQFAQWVAADQLAQRVRPLPFP
ncbi:MULTISPECIES: hypothetical protein [Alcaligenes]|uniref:hypothetical protein n=1 Tax=Alcaligenes TaxID=507 RepID=UPI001CF62F71|nr:MULTISPECIES: hypothetical protein [Alcaligenes]MCB4321060.1 hypothetical protein [Alcaligenes sp. 13f]